MNSTNSTNSTYTGLPPTPADPDPSAVETSAAPWPTEHKGGPGTQPRGKTSRLEKRKQDRIAEKNAKRNPGGDPLGNAVMTAYNFSKNLSLPVAPFAPQPPALMGNAMDTLAHATTQGAFWTAVQGVGAMANSIGRIAGNALNFQLGPQGAHSAAVTAADEGKCTVDPNGKKICDDVDPPTPKINPTPGKSIFKLYDLSRVAKQVGVKLEMSTKLQAKLANQDETGPVMADNVLFVLVDHGHYVKAVQEKITKWLQNTYEAGDPLFAETHIATRKACWGVPLADCVAMDHADSALLETMGREIQRASNAATAYLKELFPQMKGWKDIGSDPDDAINNFTANLQLYNSNRFQMNRSQKTELEKRFAAADNAKIAIDKKELELRPKRDKFMADTLIDNAGRLNGHKAPAIIGATHEPALRKALFDTVDCVFVHCKP